MPNLYCPRCDRRLSPDHRCVSRRIFLAAIFGGAACTVLTPTHKLLNAKTIGVPEPSWTVVVNDYLRLFRPGDVLCLTPLVGYGCLQSEVVVVTGTLLEPLDPRTTVARVTRSDFRRPDQNRYREGMRIKRLNER